MLALKEEDWLKINIKTWLRDNILIEIEIQHIKSELMINDNKIVPSIWDNKQREEIFQINILKYCKAYQNWMLHHNELILSNKEDSIDVIDSQRNLLTNFKMIKQYIVFGFVRRVTELSIPRCLLLIICGFFS